MLYVTVLVKVKRNEMSSVMTHCLFDFDTIYIKVMKMFGIHMYTFVKYIGVHLDQT